MAGKDVDRVKEIKAIIQIATLAIPKERESRDMYLSAARQASSDVSKRVFEELAADEARHEAKLLSIIKMFERQLKEM